MKETLKTLLCAVSLTVNAALLALLVYAGTRKTAAVSFLDMDAPGAPYTSGVCIVSVPKEQAEIIFGPVAFSLAAGNQAALQFSAVLAGSQLNLAVDPLYDHAVLAVQTSPFGLLIRALAPGETLLQTITAEGIRDIARVTVLPSP
jgi:hypothetical protein